MRISDWSSDVCSSDLNIHKVFLDGLMEVSPAVRNYHKVAEIVDYQVRLVKEYKAAQNSFMRSGLYAVEELDYIGKVYANLFNNTIGRASCRERVCQYV